MILACQKLLGQITKNWDSGRPPPLYRKNSQIIPYFSFDGLPYEDDDDGDDDDYDYDDDDDQPDKPEGGLWKKEGHQYE